MVPRAGWHQVPYLHLQARVELEEPSIKPDPNVPAEPSNFLDAYDPDKPGAHTSDTVDFVHVLSGEVTLQLERRDVKLKPGDMVIMRGTWHIWRNEGTEPCTVSSVMVGAKRVSPDDARGTER